MCENKKEKPVSVDRSIEFSKTLYHRTIRVSKRIYKPHSRPLIRKRKCYENVQLLEFLRILPRSHRIVITTTIIFVPIFKHLKLLGLRARTRTKCKYTATSSTRTDQKLHRPHIIEITRCARHGKSNNTV